MTLIDRYLAKRFAATLLKTLAAFVFLYVIIDFLTARQNSIEKYDIPLGVVFQYYVTHVTTFIFKFQALALALLVSTLLVLGRCAQDTEITALMAGGISMTRITRALVVFAALLAGGVFVFENTLGVESAKLADRIEREYFKRFTLDSDAGPSWTNLGDRNWTCHILKFNPAALTGTDVFIHAFTPGNMEEIRAHRIYWDPERTAWILEDGRWISQRRDAENPQTVTRDISRITQREAPFRESPEMLFALTEPPETRSASALHRDLVRAEAMGVPTTTSWVAFHTKFSRPVLCFVIIWLAIPFALRLRRGGLFIGFGASIALGLAYVMLYAVAVGLGAIGLLPPVVAAWLATVVFLIAGVLLFRRACA
jgi:lipopolysaccharide export system permease protein